MYNGRLQFGQTVSLALTMNPQCGQVVGCTDPRGAPQAMHEVSLIELGVSQ